MSQSIDAEVKFLRTDTERIRWLATASIWQMEFVLYLQNKFIEKSKAKKAIAFRMAVNSAYRVERNIKKLRSNRDAIMFERKRPEDYLRHDE